MKRFRGFSPRCKSPLIYVWHSHRKNPAPTVMFRGKAGKRPKVEPVHEEEDNSDEECFKEESVNEEDVEQGRTVQKRVPSKDRGRVFSYMNDSRGNLSDLGVNWNRLRRIDLRVAEKLWSFLDALQVFAVLWSLSQPWPWPRPWLRGTRWVVAVNLDFVSIKNAAMTVTGPGTKTSLYGERPGYVYFTLVLLVLPVGIQIVWYFRGVLMTLWRSQFSAFHRVMLGHGRVKPPTSSITSALIGFERVLLLLSHILYLPVVFGVVRLFVCDSDGTLSADPTTNCRSAFLILPAILGCVVVVLFTLFLKKRTTAAGYAVKTYMFNADHERFLQRVEIEYVLDLCNAWEADHLWMVSSFRRHAVRYRLNVLYLKLVLVLIYAFGRSHISDQAVMFCGVMTGWTFWTCKSPPYRCRSSNRLHYVIYIVLWIDSLFGMMTGYGVRSAVLVAGTQYRWLVALNSIGVVLAVGVAIAVPLKEELAHRRQLKLERQQRQQRIQARKQHQKVARATKDDSEKDPSVMRGGDVKSSTEKLSQDHHHGLLADDHPDEVPAAAIKIHPDWWPTHVTLAALARLPRRREWVKVIRQGKEFRFQCETCAKGLEPIGSLEAFMRRVRSFWVEAKAEDSALEPMLGSALERLALVHARMFSDAGGSGGGLTLKLEQALTNKGVIAGMERRRRAQALMTDRQRRIMLKLLAITAFLNHRDFRDSSAASVRRLRDETDRVLGQPLTETSGASLKTVCMQWKNLIKKFEREFEEAHGYPPHISDKEANGEWYECYQKLRAALAEVIPKPVSDDQSNSLRRASQIQRDFAEPLGSSPAAKENLSTLIRATEQLLLSGEPSGGDVEAIEVETCHKQWKRLIKSWEANFEERTGSPPDIRDKQAVNSYYEYYSRLRALLAT